MGKITILIRTFLFFTLLAFLFSCTYRKGLGDYVNKDAIYVSVDGSDKNDGTMYTPVKTIARGIELMKEKGYRTVKVTKGVFNAGDGFSYVDTFSGMVIDFSAEGGFTLEGGWESGFIEKTDLKEENDFTILDGGYFLNTILTIQNTSNVTIDGLLIRNNNPASTNLGGGIYITNASAININDTAFGNLRASNGAGMYIQSSYDIVIKRGIFIYNQSTGSAGGLGVDMSNRIYLNNSYFENNLSSFLGGAVTIWNSYSIEAYENMFLNNRSVGNMGGGLCLSNTNNAKLKKNGFKGNSALNGGGGLFLNWSGYVEVEESYFESNSTTGSGGGIKLLNANSIEIEKVYFEDNSADLDGGAIQSDNTSYLRILASGFSLNRAQSNGAAISLVMNVDHTTDLNGNDFGGNRAITLNSTININSTSAINNNLKIEGNKLVGTGLGTASVAISEAPNDIAGHTLNSNLFYIPGFDNYYYDAGTFSKDMAILNTPSNIMHDAAVTGLNVESP